MGQLAAARNSSSGSTARTRSRSTSRSSDPCATTSAPAASPPAPGCRRAGRSPVELGVSRGVVTEAYGQLAAEGYLHTRQGAPVRVASAVRASAPRAPARSLLPSFAYHFHPGLPDLAGFPRDRWLRSLRAAWRQAPIDAIGYADPRGVPELREALAEYLGRVRGAATDPEHTMICTGFTQGLSLLCRWLAAQEVERVALEDPGWHPHRLIVEQAGPRGRPGPGRRGGPAGRPAGGERRDRGDRHPRAPVPDRVRDEQRAAGGADRVGRDRRRPDRRGRLRRRVPLRPRRPRRPSGPGAGAGGPDRVGEQAAGAGDAARLDAVAVLARLDADLGEDGRGLGLGGGRAAGAAGLRRPRRARPPPAADAPALREPPRGAARGAGALGAASACRATAPPGSTSWSSCPGRSTRHR